MPAKIKQGKYVDSDGVQQDVVFIGAEKAIFDDNGTRLDNKLNNISKASGLTAEDAEGILGTADANVNFQALVDAIADKVMNELVTNSALTTQLANYVTKAMMSNVQVNDNNHVPTSGLVYGMNEDINQLSSDLSVVDRFIVQPNTTEENVVDWIKSFGSGKKSINLFQTTRDLMFGEAGNFYILLARNAEAEEITGIAINSWNQHAFSFKYDTSFSYSKLTTNADLAIGTVRIQTTNGEAATSQVSFGKTFSSTPKVFCNIKTSVPSNKWINAGNVSTTGFTIYADVDVTGSITVDWFAVAI